MPSIVNNIKTNQLLWAKERGIAVDNSGYTIERNDHLFLPLCGASLAEFQGADGGELGSQRRARQASVFPRPGPRAAIHG
jgi:hypothetical protein